MSTVSQPVASIAAFSPGQSAWSDRTKPRSTPLRRRGPRSCIQPLANAVATLPNFRSQVEPSVDGGATIIAPAHLPLSSLRPAYCVSGSGTPAAR